ncbi:ABC transporter family substrate-binding protein [Streptomyces kunmingensis]|uniref:ABC transporter family substrate-binding protein n=1 Tax=Streptomyces kunmingensis TaxID=68225 RepID=A0ABU6CLK9_9ACTN|nr:ABC transporter family substrate-binding protein [Streptomyces kunmingensis]MEB3965532.1 ABC transporter family substrate-binding protein [Streptomyces kunmingensis]
MLHNPRRPGAATRSAAFLVSGALAVTALAGCGSDDDEAGTPSAGQDIAPAARDRIEDGGSLRWAIDSMPGTLNTFQADADRTTGRIAGAVLPSMFRLDAQGRPQRDADYLEKAEVIETEPKQVVQYKLNQKAVWSDGREIGAPDFAAQWRALSGKDSAFWTAHNAGYDRIEKIERGADDLEVRVTFSKPYADWRALFSPLYPKDVMGTPDSFNDGARRRLKVTAGPFDLDSVDRDAKKVTLERNLRWWGRGAKLDKVVLTAVPRAKRATALAAGRLDLAGLDLGGAERLAHAARDQGASGPLTHGPGSALTPAKALRSWAIAHGEDEEAADEEIAAREKTRKAVKKYAKEQANLHGFEVRKSLEPAFTQLALNGAEGPLADERVRRAVARALDRRHLAEVALKPLGLPVTTVDNHLALAGQSAYSDNSNALGDQDTAEAQALLAEAGWVPGGPVEEKKEKPKTAGGQADGDAQGDGEDGKPGDHAPLLGPGPVAAAQHTALLHQADAVQLRAADKEKKKHPGGHHKKSGHGEHTAESLGKSTARYGSQGGAPGAYAPMGTAAPGGAAAGALAKDGKPLTLRFVLPSGPGSEQLRSVADEITRMLRKIGVRTDVMKVDDESYFKDHIASGEYDLALYTWPASAYPATDGRPIYAKPVPAADGSLTVEQNYTRVGTDHIDQLFDQAIGELDADEERSLMKQADAQIWAAAGSIPLYQRPELVAARPDLANAGAFGFQEPEYEDIGYLKKSRK